jgi:hypothetical protein
MLEAISNRKGRFPIQKHQKLRQHFTIFVQSKQTTESCARSLTSSMCLSSYWTCLGTNQKARSLNVVVKTILSVLGVKHNFKLLFFDIFFSRQK